MHGSVVNLDKSSQSFVRSHRTRRRVLVAEDDSTLRTMIAIALRRAGCDVVEVSDGAELLARLDERVRQGDPDAFHVIVSDVRMPNRSGIDVLSALKEAQRTTPVILITGYDTESTYAEACELGAVAVLDKPIDLDQLRGAVLKAGKLYR